MQLSKIYGNKTTFLKIVPFTQNKISQRKFCNSTEDSFQGWMYLNLKIDGLRQQILELESYKHHKGAVKALKKELKKSEKEMLCTSDPYWKEWQCERNILKLRAVRNLLIETNEEGKYDVTIRCLQIQMTIEKLKFVFKIKCADEKPDDATERL